MAKMLKEERKTRKSLGQIEEIDREATTRSYHIMQEQEKVLLRRIQAGAVWNAVYESKTRGEEVRCPICAGEKGYMHMWYKCKGEKMKERKQTLIRQLPHLEEENLPEAIMQYGVASAISTEYGEPYWGDLGKQKFIGDGSQLWDDRFLENARWVREVLGSGTCARKTVNRYKGENPII